MWAKEFHLFKKESNAPFARNVNKIPIRTQKYQSHQILPIYVFQKKKN